MTPSTTHTAIECGRAHAMRTCVGMDMVSPLLWMSAAIALLFFGPHHGEASQASQYAYAASALILLANLVGHRIHEKIFGSAPVMMKHYRIAQTSWTMTNVLGASLLIGAAFL